MFIPFGVLLFWLLRFPCYAGALGFSELACEGEGADRDQDGRDPDERERCGCRYEERRDRGDDHGGRNGSEKKR